MSTCHPTFIIRDCAQILAAGTQISTINSYNGKGLFYSSTSTYQIEPGLAPPVCGPPVKLIGLEGSLAHSIKYLAQQANAASRQGDCLRCSLLTLLRLLAAAVARILIAAAFDLDV